MIIKDFCPNNSMKFSSIFSIEAITSSIKTATFIVPCFFSSLFEPFIPSKKSSEPLIYLHKLNNNNINVIHALSNFRNVLEGYHPGKIKKTFTFFMQQYEQHQNDTAGLKEKHEIAFKKFEGICNDILKKDFSNQKKKEIKTSFEKFFILFKTFDSPECHATKSNRLHQQLDQAIQYAKEKKMHCLQSLKDVKEEFNYEKNKDDVVIYENKLKKFQEICKDVLKGKFQGQEKTEINGFFEKFLLDSWTTASHLLDECNSTVMGSQQLYIELDKVIQYIETNNILSKEALGPLQKLKDQFTPKNIDQEQRQTTTHRKLLDSVAEASALIELFTLEKPSSNHFHKEAQKTILQEIEKILSLIKKDTNQEMRLSPEKANSLTLLKKKLQLLPKENPSLFTQREQTILGSLQKDLHAISYGKTFHTKDLQEKLHQCHDIIKEVLPNTVFMQMTDILGNLKEIIAKNIISFKDHRKIINSLNFLSTFINNPRIFPPNKITIEELKGKFLDIDPNRAITSLNSLINTHRLFVPNARVFKECKNTYPSMQKELDRLYPLKKMAFKKVKAGIFSQGTLDLLDSFINSPYIRSDEKTKIENLKEKLSSIVPDQEVFSLLDSLINNPKIPCRANQQAFEALQEKFSTNTALDAFYPMEKDAFETLQNKLSSVVPDQEALDLLDSFINNPNIPFQASEKAFFEDIQKKLSSLDKMVLDCLYPLEKSLLEDIKERLSSFKQESIDRLSYLSNSPIDKSKVAVLSEESSPILELLDALITDPTISEEKKQICKSLQKSFSSIKERLSSNLTPEDFQEILSIISDQTLQSITAIKNLSITDEKERKLTTCLSAIKITARAYLHSMKKTHVKDAKESLSSINAEVLASLHSLASDPRISYNEKAAFTDLINDLSLLKQAATTHLHSLEKLAFENVKKSFSSITPGQNLSQQESASLQVNIDKCSKLIKEMEQRTPLKERNKIIIEEEIQKLAKHATNLSFMMLINKNLFNAAKDSLFYRKIIQRAEETSSCPKKILLAELQREGASKWKIMAAKAYFFVIKHLRIEKYVYNTILRTMTNYSKLLYQALEQEYNQDQFSSLLRRIIKNTTIYFQLLSSAASNAKEDVQIHPDQLTALIIKQLLLLKAQENEAILKDLDLKSLYNKLADDLIEKSESGLLKWIAPWLNSYKHRFVSSVIEAGTDSLLNPASNGNASTANVLLRDGLKTFYKKWHVIADKEINLITDEDINILIQKKELQTLTTQEKTKASERKKNIGSFVESLMGVLNEYRANQQIASTVKIIISNEEYLQHLKNQALVLKEFVNPQIETMEKEIYLMRLKLDLLIKSALQGEARKSLPLYPSVKYWIGQLEKIGPRPEDELRENIALPFSEVMSDKIKNAIRPIVDNAIKEEITLALTELLEQPFSEDLVYDLLYQGLFSVNLTIENPKENKETQKAVEQEITELINDDSFAIACAVPAMLAKKYLRFDFLVNLAKKISPMVAGLPSSVIEERFQDIVSVSRQKAVFQPEAVFQLSRRIVS